MLLAKSLANISFIPRLYFYIQIFASKKILFFYFSISFYTAEKHRFFFYFNAQYCIFKPFIFYFQIFEYSISNNSTAVQLSECFHNLILFVPFIFLLIAFPIVLYDLKKSENASISFMSPVTLRIVRNLRTNVFQTFFYRLNIFVSFDKILKTIVYMYIFFKISLNSLVIYSVL